MPTLWERLRFAWAAFMLRDCTIELPFEDIGGEFYQYNYCDNSDIWRTCTSKKMATVALYKLRATIHVCYTDPYLLCEDCAKKAAGTFEKPRHK